VSKLTNATCICLALAISLVAATQSEARPTRQPARVVDVPAAPVALIRSDTDLFSATLAGRFAQGTANPGLAAQAWSRAFMRRPADADLFERALDASLEAGDVANAVRLAKLAAPTVRNEDAALVLAVDAFAAGRYGDVSRALTAVTFQPSLRLFVDHLNAYALLGQSRNDTATELTARATGTPALDKMALMSRAMILDRAGRPAEAGILFQSSLDSGSAAPVGVRTYGDWLIANQRAPDAVTMYLRLIKAGGIEASGFSAALSQLQAPTRRNPALDLRATAANGLTTIAQGLAGQGRSASPLTLFHLIAYLDPRSDAASLALAQQLIAQSLGERAVPILERVAPASPDYFAARSELAWLTCESEPQNAIAIARQTLQLQPQSSAAQRLLADILAANRGDGEAETLYSRLIDDGHRAGQSNEEIWPLYFGRGGARERQGKWALALADLRFAKTAAPNQPNVLNYLGYALADRGESLEEALSMLRTAARLRPRSGAIQDSLGWALFQAGRYEDAVSTLETAANMAPALAEISDHLGDAYWRSGREDEARMEWARTLRLTITPEQRTRVTAKIRDGLPALTPQPPTRAIAAQSAPSLVP
jgi:tetratricopeptide (TPR) repeat protein